MRARADACTPWLFAELAAPAPRGECRAELRKPAAREAQDWCARMRAAASPAEKDFCRRQMVAALLLLDETRRH